MQIPGFDILGEITNKLERQKAAENGNIPST
jgi:hypothetical protein